MTDLPRALACVLASCVGIVLLIVAPAFTSAQPAPDTAVTLAFRPDSLLTPSGKAPAVGGPPAPNPLPPLSVVVEYARKNAPELAVQEAIVARSQHEVERTEKRWMEGVTVGASSSYGSFGNSVVDAVEIGQRLEVGIKVSLFDLLGRDASVGVFRERLEAAKRQRRVLAQAVRKQVIERYYAAKQARELTVVQSRSYTSTQTQLQMAEASFQQGTLSVDKLSRVTEVAAKAEARFRKARLRYKKAYDQLERLIGTSLGKLQGADLQQATVTSPDASGSH
jgi:outer membrane protein TolC